MCVCARVCVSVGGIGDHPAARFATVKSSSLKLRGEEVQPEPRGVLMAEVMIVSSFSISF